MSSTSLGARGTGSHRLPSCALSATRKVVRELWNDFYGPRLYPDLWFQWEGKPLILADPALLDKDQGDLLNFFTFRKPQPDYFAGPTGPRQWGWLEVYPQHAFYAREGVPEEVTVGVAQNAVDGKLGVLSHPNSQGRSFHDHHQPGPEAQDHSGRNFAEQWRLALQIDPAFVFVTGWNEWIAGRFDSSFPLAVQRGYLLRRVQPGVQPRHRADEGWPR